MSSADTDPEPPPPRRKRALSWRPGIWLTTLSTVVAVATGMFTLRDQIFPQEAGTAPASVALYEQSVGDICSSLNEADRARAANARRLAKRLRGASGRTPLGQRNALLDSIKPVLQRSEHNLARFKGLDAPRTRARLHRETEAGWDDSVWRLRRYAQSLDAATNQDDVLAAVQVLSATRGPLASDGVKRAANLTKLAGGRCRLDEPIVTPTVTLPRIARSVDPNSTNPNTDGRGRRSQRAPSGTNPSPSVDPPSPNVTPPDPSPSVDPPPAPPPPSR